MRKGKYVEIEPEELDAVQIESNHTIDIESFVPREEIDQRFLNHPYYIAPDGKAPRGRGLPHHAGAFGVGGAAGMHLPQLRPLL